jgi:hypothetical protein
MKDPYWVLGRMRREQAGLRMALEDMKESNGPDDAFKALDEIQAWVKIMRPLVRQKWRRIEKERDRPRPEKRRHIVLAGSRHGVS